MKILVIEDNHDHFELIEDIINDMPLSPSVLRAQTLSEGLSLIQDTIFDVCLLDLQLPDSSIENTIKVVREQHFAVPLIALTSANDTKLSQALLEAGVQDYLSKDEVTVAMLDRACRYAIQRKHYLVQFEKSNKNLDAFCASLSHDFLNHVHRIQQISDILKTSLAGRVSLTDTDTKWFSFLSKSTTDIKTLIMDLRQFLSVGSQSGKKEAICLKSMLEQIIDKVIDPDMVQVEVDYQQCDGTVTAFPSLLFLLLQNLIANAMKYNDNIVKITIKTEQTEQGTYVDVIDNGIGFDTSKVNEIFEPFTQLNKESNGSGLGLSICQAIVDAHNGKISAHSVLGEGAQFIIWLPEDRLPHA